MKISRRFIFQCSSIQSVSLKCLFSVNQAYKNSLRPMQKHKSWRAKTKFKFQSKLRILIFNTMPYITTKEYETPTPIVDLKGPHSAFAKPPFHWSKSYLFLVLSGSPLFWNFGLSVLYWKERRFSLRSRFQCNF